MWSIAICDDNKQDCYKLEELLQTYCGKKGIAMETDLFYNGSSLHEKMEGGKRYDLIFLDILMFGMNGIDVANGIRIGLDDEEAQLVYMSHITGYADLLLQCRPMGFLKKPIHETDVFQIADYARKLGFRFHQWFSYRKGRVVYQVPYKDILYFQSLGRKIEIHMMDEIREFYGKLSEIQDKGLPEYFVQIHQSYIVNRDYVMERNREKVYLKYEKGYLSISLRYRQSAAMRLSSRLPMSNFAE